MIARANHLILHNAAYDAPILVANGLMTTADIAKIDDTVVTARLATPGETISKSLGDACERHLGGNYGELKKALEVGFRAITGRTKAALFDELGLGSSAFVAYSAFDVVVTARLAGALPGAVVDRITTTGPFRVTGDPAYLIDREQTVNRMLLFRSAKGIEIDFDAVDTIKAHLADDVARSAAVLLSCGIDPDRSVIHVKTDVVALLAGKALLPRNWPILKDGTPSRDASWLSKLDHPLTEAVTTLSKAEKFRNDYADKIPSAGPQRSDPSPGHVLAATTGRMSYSSPPLQQYPAAVRRMMRCEVPITSFDWSSIEPVFVANAAGDAALLEGRGRRRSVPTDRRRRGRGPQDRQGHPPDHLSARGSPLWHRDWV